MHTACSCVASRKSQACNPRARNDITAKLYGYMLVKQFYWVLVASARRSSLMQPHDQQACDDGKTEPAQALSSVTPRLTPPPPPSHALHVCMCIRPGLLYGGPQGHHLASHASAPDARSFNPHSARHSRESRANYMQINNNFNNRVE